MWVKVAAGETPGGLNGGHNKPNSPLEPGERKRPRESELTAPSGRSSDAGEGSRQHGRVEGKRRLFPYL